MQKGVAGCTRPEVELVQAGGCLGAGTQTFPYCREAHDARQREQALTWRARSPAAGWTAGMRRRPRGTGSWE